LADVRREIKELESRQAKLRSYLLANPHDRHGDEYCALISPQEYKRVDLKALAVEIGEETMRRHTITKEISFVRLAAVRRRGGRAA
jgi:hypothetical protein